MTTNRTSCLTFTIERKQTWPDSGVFEQTAMTSYTSKRKCSVLKVIIRRGRQTSSSRPGLYLEQLCHFHLAHHIAVWLLRYISEKEQDHRKNGNRTPCGCAVGRRGPLLMDDMQTEVQDSLHARPPTRFLGL
ncbi:hypothetical protein J6590_105217 [Homalodisca vitripennis]|nr:hypothetical protein J6590_105217 [Homalodisca vitripennis]